MAYMKDDTGRRLDSIGIEAISEAMPNLLHYGVERGGASGSQGAKIMAALEANPGKPFRLPPGDYATSETVRVKASNTLHCDGARLYATAPMSRLLDYRPDLPAGQYSEDQAVVGGVFDGMRLAETVVSFQQILRMSFTRFTIRDGINRGLVTQPGTGAELTAYDGRFYNTSGANAADNVAIDNQMGDNHFDNIYIRDWTIGVRDNNGARFTKIHPWLGGSQIAARYANSIAFDLTDASNVENCYADTYRTAFKSNASGGRPRLRNVRAAWNPALPDVLAQANQSYVFDNSAGAGFYVIDRLDLGGKAAAPSEFILGATAKMDIADWPIGSGNILNVRPLRNGARVGFRTFTPNVFGSSTSGSQTYGSRSGQMEVRDGLVTYRFSVSVTLGSTISGNLRIGGLPFVEGAGSVNIGHGAVTTASGAATAVGLTGANGSGPGDLAAIPLTIAGAELSGSALAGTALLLRGSITCPFDYAA